MHKNLQCCFLLFVAPAANRTTILRLSGRLPVTAAVEGLVSEWFTSVYIMKVLTVDMQIVRINTYSFIILAACTMFMPASVCCFTNFPLFECPDSGFVNENEGIRLSFM